MADWASSGSAMSPNHSTGSRFDVTTVADFDDELVDVGGVGRVEGLEGEVVDHEEVDPQQLADLGVVAVVEAAGA